MKKISFKMCDNFKISLLARNNVYELENNATILEIDCDVNEALTYKLHVLHKDEKNVLLMDKNESSISAMLTDAYFSDKGIYYIQIEGIKNDFRIVSNQIRLEVGAFINAEHIPTPEEQSIIDRLAIKVTALENDVDLIKGNVTTLDSYISTLRADLEEEKRTRFEQDDILNDSINDLSRALSAAIRGYQSLISNEASERLEADNELDNKKADKADTYTKTSIDLMLMQKASNALVGNTKKELEEKIAQKQDTLVAGENIVIEGNKISSTGGGSNVTITDNTDGSVKLTVNGVSRNIATSQQIADKIEFYKVDFDGENLTRDGVILTFNDLVEKYNDEQYFLFVEGVGFTYIPSMPPVEGDPLIEFSSNYKYLGVPTIATIKMNGDNELKFEQTYLEDSGNKVNAINDDNKISVNKYPSNKAITDYVDAENAKQDVEISAIKTKTSAMPQDVQIDGTSILENGVANIPFASQSIGGVFKAHQYYGLGMNNDGELYGRVLTPQQYSNLTNSGIISKGTLDNIKSNLTKRALTDNTQAEWTEAEKLSAKKRIGVDETDRSLDALWKLNKGQTYDFEQKLETGMNIAPSGAKYESLIDVRGNSIQDGEPSSDNPVEIHSVEELNFKVATGKNIFNLQDFANKYVTSGSSLVGRYPVYVGGGKKVTLSTDYRRKNGFTSIFLLTSVDDTATSALGAYYEHPRTVTAISDYVWVGLYFSTTQDYQTTYQQLIEQGVNIQLEYGESATDFEPYREETKQIIPPFALNGIGDVYDYADIDNGIWIKKFKEITEADYTHSIKSETSYFLLTTPTETPISQVDLEYLKSLTNLNVENNIITINDGNGNDVSYLMEYIIKLNEVN